MSDITYEIKYMLMSEEEVEKINGSNIRKIFDVIESELKRREYLWQRYSREKQLAEYRNAKTEEEKSKLSIIASREKTNTDTAAGYFFGKPVNYYNRQNPGNKIKKRIDFTGNEREYLLVDEKESKKYKQGQTKEEKYLQDYIEICSENNEPKHNINLVQDTLTCSTAYEIIFKKDEKICFGKLDPTECTMTYSDEVSSTPVPTAFIRKYTKKDYFTDANTEIYELYTRKRRVAYKFTKGEKSPEEVGLVFADKPEIKQLPSTAEEIPIVEYPMCERIGFYEQEIPGIEEYERAQTSTKRTFQFNENDAKLLLSGISGEPEEGETPEQMIVRLLKSRILFNQDTEGGTDFAKWLTKKIDDSALTHHKNSLNADVYSGLGIFDPARADTVYHSETGLKYKLYGLETKMSELEHVYKEGLDRRRKIITEMMNAKNSTDYDYRTIGITFTRNIPLSLTEYATLAKMLESILPLEEIYKLLPMIENPSDMVERQIAWKETMAKIEAKLTKIMSDATEKDITPDRLKQQEADNAATV